jgi:hypothetical protein
MVSRILKNSQSGSYSGVVVLLSGAHNEAEEVKHILPLTKSYAPAGHLDPVNLLVSAL